MRRKKRIVLWAAVCKNGTVHWTAETRDVAERIYLREGLFSCGPHRTARLSGLLASKRKEAQ